MARELKEINQEYGTICAQLGEKVYQTALLQSQMKELQKRCLELQEEGNKAVEESKKSEEVKNAIDGVK